MTAFHEVQLPPSISRGATGGPAHKTTIVPTDAGFEQRNADWAKARGQWDISYGIKTRTDMNSLLAFHYARRGRLYGFRFKDWSDFDASLQVIVADAAAGQTTAQLTKTYSDSGGSYVRTIYKPVSGTVSLYLNGSGTPMAGVSVNTATGVVTFSALSAHDVVRATFEFDTPVRFDSDDLRIQTNDPDILEVPAINLVELRPDVPEPSTEQHYPRGLTVTNPGAELGATGWTNETGTLSTIGVSGAVIPHEGALSFRFLAGASGLAYQDIAIPVACRGDVDANLVSVRLLWWQTCFASGNDQGEMIVSFRDDIGSEIDNVAAGLTSPTSWTLRTIETPIPSDTRTLRIKMHGNRLVGTDLDAYFDMISLLLIAS